MRHLLLAVLLVAMTGCGSETAAQEDQPTTPAKEPQPRALAETATLKGHTNAVLSVSLSPDGTRIASGGRDDAIRLWDVTP